MVCQRRPNLFHLPTELQVHICLFDSSSTYLNGTFEVFLFTYFSNSFPHLSKWQLHPATYYKSLEVVLYPLLPSHSYPIHQKILLVLHRNICIIRPLLTISTAVIQAKVDIISCLHHTNYFVLVFALHSLPLNYYF